MTSPTGALDIEGLRELCDVLDERKPLRRDIPLAEAVNDWYFAKQRAGHEALTALPVLLTRIESDAAEIERQRAEIELLLRQRTRLMERVVKAETSLRAVASGGATKRCLFTGNPVGTDTWKVGSECQCVMCADTRRAALQTEAPDHA